MKTNFEIRPILWSMLRSKTTPLLVAIQIALSLAILANALYIVNLRLSLASRASGASDETVLFRSSVNHMMISDHNEQIALQKRETEAIRAVPGVVETAYTTQALLSGTGGMEGISLDRRQVNPSATVSTYISPDSLIRTWGLKLVEGRDFKEDEIPEFDFKAPSTAPKVIVITRALAEKLFPATNQVTGKTIYMGPGEKATELRIVGVVEKLQSHNAETGLQGEYSVILPARFSNYPFSTYNIRTAPGQRDRVLKEVETALRKTSADPIVINTRTMTEDRSNRYRSETAVAWMLVVVSALLVLVTASGIVGISTLWVAQRRKHIGVRRALGARKIDILRYFITENVLITTGGVMAGVLLAFALNAFLISQFELTKLPLTYFIIAPLIFMGLGVIAVFAPAWRAASISPAIATRSV